MSPAGTRHDVGSAPASAVACVACGSAGVPLYLDLADQLYGAPGRWRMVRCSGSDCGLLWLDPPPSQDCLHQAYEGYFTHEAPRARSAPSLRLRRWIKEGYYAARFGYPVRGSLPKRLLALALLARPGLGESLDAAILCLRPLAGGRLLDVGCGAGAMLAQLGALGWRAEGVDLDPAAVAAATVRGLLVHAGSLAQQRYPDASFDAVTLSHVLEHVLDPLGLLAECRRVLESDGRLVLATPNAASLGHERFARHWRGLEPPRHVHVFTRQALERLVRAAGLRALELRTSARLAAFMHAESRRIAGEAGASTTDATARRFAREEKARLAADPWAGEELVLVAARA